MMPIVNEAMLTLSGSPGASILAKATVITALGLIGVLLAHRSRAAARHALLAATFGVLLALPLASFVFPPVRIPIPAPVQERPPALAGSVKAAPAAGPLLPRADVGSAATPSAARSTSDLLLTGWIAGTAVFLLPVVMGLLQVRSIRRSALPWSQGQTFLERLTLETGVQRRVDVLLHHALPGPMTCGVVHPAIVLPQDAQAWNPEDVTRAIVHELEHVKRADWVSHCLARAVCALYWFHPLVWIAWRRLALEAERSCDDAVLGRSDAAAYADQLLELAQRLSTASKSPLLAMASRADLATRVRAALDKGQRRGRAGTLLVSLACAGAAVLVLTLSPLKMVAAPQTAVSEIRATPAPAKPMARAPEAAVPNPHGKANRALGAISPPKMVAAAQADAQSPPMPRFVSSTLLVMVNVTVSESNGRSLEGLTPRDFVVTEDGLTQSIAFFEFGRLAGAAGGPQDYYTLGYYTANAKTDAAFRKIKIALRMDGVARLDYRDGYYSAKPGASAGAAADSSMVSSNGPGAPALLYKVEPEYSDIARRSKYQGTVILFVEVDAAGQVGNIRVGRSLGLGLDEKAIEAVKRWKFKPGTKDGRPVDMLVQVDLNFRLL